MVYDCTFYILIIRFTTLNKSFFERKKFAKLNNYFSKNKLFKKLNLLSNYNYQSGIKKS